MSESGPKLNLSLQQYSHFKNLPARSSMQRWMRAALEKDGMFTVRFVDLEEGYELNHTYRGKEKATNILTFDYAVDPVIEADLVVCVPVLEQESREQNKTLKEHLAHLLIHGVLHAQGYDHMNDEEAEVMEAKEVEIMTKLGFESPYEQE